MLTAVVFIAILFSAVFVHELAHYLAARAAGLIPRSFSIGFGPVLAKKMFQGTEWRISLLPLGGYVDIPGMAPIMHEDGTVEPPTTGFATRSTGRKVSILGAGVVANYIFGSLLLATAILLQPGFGSLLTGSDPVVIGTEIAAVQAHSHAAELGLPPGAMITVINGMSEPTPEQLIEAVSTADALHITYVVGGVTHIIETPWPLSDERLLGVNIAPAIAPFPPLQAVGQSFVFGIRMVPEMVKGFVKGFGSALVGRQSEEVAGPVGVVGLVGQAAQAGLAQVLFLAAVMNYSLAVFNILPIPGLDGGRIVLTLVTHVRGKPFKPGQEERFHFFGIMAVLLLIVLITFQELASLVTG